MALLAVACALLVPALSAAQSPSPTSSLLVKLVDGLSAQEQADVIARDGGIERSVIPVLRLHVIEVPPSDLATVRANYQVDPQVVSVEENRTRVSETVPGDPLYPNQWALPQIGWDQVFGKVAPAGTATVALLDTGVDAFHPDLAGQVVPGTSILDGSNGMTDPSGHGTWLAGIIAAQTDNVPVEGIAGVAYAGVTVMPVTVLNVAGEGQDSDIIAGVIWAADHGADVILMAFSNPGFSPNLQDAIDYAWSKGAVLVAAVGNDAVSHPTFPAGDRGVMGVSATDPTDTLASFSNRGQAVFLAAPGTDIQTTDAGDAYTIVSGTSASAAIVAGAAAFMRAVDPTLSNGVIVGRLARMADPAGTQDQTGNGRINMARALADAGTDFVQPAGAAPVGGGGPFVGPYRAAVTTVTFNATNLGDDVTPSTAVLSVTIGAGPAVTVTKSDLPKVFAVVSGTSIAYSYTSPIAGTSATTRYLWRTTAGTGSASGQRTQSGSFTASADSSVTANYTAQLQTTTTLNAIPSPLRPGQTNVSFSGKVDSLLPPPAESTVELRTLIAGCSNSGIVTGIASTDAGGNFSGTFTAPSTFGTFSYKAHFPQVTVFRGTSAAQWTPSDSDCRTVAVGLLVTFDATNLGGDVTASTAVLSVTIGAGPAVTTTKSDLPKTFVVLSGTSISYSYNSPIASTSVTKQYRWSTTAGTGSAAGRTTQSGSFTASANSSVTANYTTQFQLTFAQSGIGGDSTGSVVTINGSVTKTAAQLPFSAFFDRGATVTYAYADPVASTVAGQRYALTTPAATPARPITVSGAATITGTYKVQFQLTFAQSGIGADSTGTVVTVAGNPKTAGDLPFSAFYDPRVTVTYAYADPVASTVAGQRYAPTTPAATPASPITVSGAATITGTYTTQFQLALSVSPPALPGGLGNVSGGTHGQFYDAGTVLTLAATTPIAGEPGVGYVFSNWTGGVTPSPNGGTPVSVTMNEPQSVTANYAALVLAWAAGRPFAAQYSDPARLSVVLTLDGAAIASKTIGFAVGSGSGTALTDSTGRATDTTRLTQAPGSYAATVTCPVAQCGVLLSITHDFTVTKEDARVTYTGALFSSTASATSSTATVMLSATIQDITAVPGDFAYDADAGDIRKATLTFVNRAAGGTVLCTAPIGLVNLADRKTGTATCDWMVDIGSLESAQYTIGVIVGGYYLRDASVDDTAVIVSKPLNPFITGGGLLVFSNPARPKAGDPGSKAHFRFNVKYNRNGADPQGQLNAIIRGNGRVYQVKANSVTSLSVQPPACSIPPCRAVLSGKANIRDITDPASPVSIDENAALQVTMTDNGKPGRTDTIAITVWDEAGGLWFSSSWNGTATVEQPLDGGNLVVH